MMLQKHMLDVIAAATGYPPATVVATAKYLRQAGLIAGKEAFGRSAPEATVHDATRILLALVSGERRTEAVADMERTLGLVTNAADLQRTLGLVADVNGREQPIDATVKQMLEALIANGDLGDVVDVRIAISRPWPSAILSMAYVDHEVRNVVFQHREARLDGSADQIRRLSKRWGYLGPGASTWSVLELSALTAVADALAGRTEGPEEPVPQLPQLPALGAAALPAGFAVFARARSGPPQSRGAKRARARSRK